MTSARDLMREAFECGFGAGCVMGSEAVQRDAERYRWLRDKSPIGWELLVDGRPCWKFDFDAAIDADMQSDPQVTGSGNHE